MGRKLVHAREAGPRLRGKRPGHGVGDESGGARAHSLGTQAVVQRRMSWRGAVGHVQQRWLAPELIAPYACQTVAARPWADSPLAVEIFRALVSWRADS